MLIWTYGAPGRKSCPLLYEKARDLRIWKSPLCQLKSHGRCPAPRNGSKERKNVRKKNIGALYWCHLRLILIIALRINCCSWSHGNWFCRHRSCPACRICAWPQCQRIFLKTRGFVVKTQGLDAFRVDNWTLAWSHQAQYNWFLPLQLLKTSVFWVTNAGSLILPITDAKLSASVWSHYQPSSLSCLLALLSD